MRIRVAVLGIALFAVPLFASATKPKVSMDAARKTALTRVPSGKIESGELEREHGKLIYSFDIRKAGESGVTEVQVDANSGAIVSVKHEIPAHEAAEKKKEAKEQKH